MRQFFKKFYFPLLVTNTAFFGLDLVIAFLPLFFIFKIPLSICGLIASKDEKFDTEDGDIVILVMAIVSMIPWVGVLCDIAGLVFCIINLVKYRKYKRYLARKSNREQDSYSI